MTERKRPWYCVDCGRPESEAGRISRRGLCINCASIRIVESVEQQVAKSGDLYDKWQRNRERAAANLLGGYPPPRTGGAIDVDRLSSSMMSNSYATSRETEGG